MCQVIKGNAVHDQCCSPSSLIIIVHSAEPCSLDIYTAAILQSLLFNILSLVSFLYHKESAAQESPSHPKDYTYAKSSKDSA